MSREGERGSATILALIVFVVVAILLCGLTIVPFSLSMSVKHTDLVQAQYAAEAGVKRVVASCNALNDGVTVNWDWVENDQRYIDNQNAFYNTKIEKISGGKPAWALGNAIPTDGTYRITSVGKVNGTGKKVVAIVNITNSVIYSGIIPNVTMYADGDIDSPNYNLGINTNGLPVYAKGDITNVYSMTDNKNECKEKTSLTLPKLNYNSYMNSDPNPTLFNPTNQDYNLTASNGKYYYNGNLNVVNRNSSLNINGASNGSIIFVNGDINIDAGNNPINFNNPVLIVAIGDVTIRGSSCSQVAVLAMKREDGTGGEVTIESSNLNGTMIMAEGDVTLKCVSNCNSNQDLVNKIRLYLESLNQNNPSVVSCTIQEWRGE